MGDPWDEIAGGSKLEPGQTPCGRQGCGKAINPRGVPAGYCSVDCLKDHLYGQKSASVDLHAMRMGEKQKNRVHPKERKGLRKALPARDIHTWVHMEKPQTKEERKAKTASGVESGCAQENVRNVTSLASTDKRYRPYSTLDTDSVYHQKKELEQRRFEPTSLFLPKRAKEPKPKKKSKDDPSHSAPSLSASAPTSPTGGSDRPTSRGRDKGRKNDLVTPMAKGKAKGKPYVPPKTPDCSCCAQSRAKPVKLEDREPWDTEHHIMYSRMNHQVQTLCREYFDRPIRKEDEGVPKLRELYTMNDRQTAWNDAPDNQDKSSRRTFFNNIGPNNVAGPKMAQLPSYWRKIRRWHSFSAPTLHLDEPAVKQPKQNLQQKVPWKEGEDPPSAMLMALANLPAAKSTEFWREWVKHQESLPPDERHQTVPLDPGQKSPVSPARSRSSPLSGQKSPVPSPKTRGGWPTPGEDPSMSTIGGRSSPAASSGFKGDLTLSAGGQTLTGAAGDRPREKWDDRFSVMVSKDNENLCGGHRQYFTSAQYNSGAELGHPGTWLGLQSNQWRNVTKTTVTSPSGAMGRTSLGRTALLV